MSAKVNAIKDILKMDHSQNTGIVTITPAMAEELLKYNSNNRGMSPSRVKEYAEAMANGTFMLAESVIGFNSEGVLTNGQTRLQACVNSKKKFKSIVCTDLAQNMHIDTGRKRTMSQNILLCKVLDGIIIPSKDSIETVSKLLVMAKYNKVVTPEVTVDFCKNYGYIIDELYNNEIFKQAKHVAPSRRSVLAAFLAAGINGVDITHLVHIKEVLSTGVTDSRRDVIIIKLRDKLMKLLQDHKSSTEKQAYLLTQDAIYAYVDNSNKNTLRTNERYPVIV